MINNLSKKFKTKKKDQLETLEFSRSKVISTSLKTFQSDHYLIFAAEKLLEYFTNPLNLFHLLNIILSSSVSSPFPPEVFFVPQIIFCLLFVWK